MRFNIATHSVTGQPMVEVFLGDKLLVCIYGDPGLPALKIVSKHLLADQAMAISDGQFPPAVLLPFSVP